MRLYLTIQRHGLPVTRILWTTAPAPALNAPTTSANSSFTSASSATLVSTRAPNAGFGATGGCTISQLLEDVNEVVPLETASGGGEEVYGGGQWGLEDYAVEIGGYECLHFMEVDGMLKDGDEVLIRALQTTDLKARRLTGRHQISADGRHLIDGVPFGKPYLQRSASSRPPITIPPRKRRRLAIGGWDGEAEDYDHEYVGIYEDGEEAAGKELALVHHDSSEESSMDDYDAEVESADEEREQSPIAGDEDEGSLNEELKELEQESRQAASLPDHIKSGTLKRRRRGLEESGTAVLNPLRSNNSPPKDAPRDEVFMQSSPYASTPQRRKSSIAASTPPSRKSGKMRKSSSLSPPTTKNVRFQKAANVHNEKSSSDEETSDSESQEDSAESSESDNGDGSESTSSASNPDQDSVSSSSSSSASTTSSSDSSDEDVSSSESEAAQKASSSITPPKKQMNIPPKVNPPGNGSGPTKSKNRRTKTRRRLMKMKSLGILGPEANFADLQNWDAIHAGDDPRLAISQYEQKIESQKKDEQSEFEAKRQQLLQNLAYGGVDVNEYGGKENVPPQKTETGIETSTQSPKGSVSTPTGHLVDSSNENLSESATKRMKLDIAGSRRLLFGSLGVRTPKTKEDEEETRKKLAGKVNDAYIASQKSSVPDLGTDADFHGDEFHGDWEEKLILKATECIYDDIPLSTPPFPFEQRWDEDAQATIRQRKGTKRSRKRKRNLHYAQEEPAVEEDNTGYFNDDEGLNYDDNEEGPAKQLTSQSNDHAEGDLPIRPAGDARGDVPIEDDLPTLPDDLSELAGFTKEDVKAGAIVAFKQLDMSKETNWQPQVSEYRVAAIENVEGSTIQLCLAQRDRKQHFADNDEDEDSRTYRGFEMPGYDDEDNAEDDGLREVSFNELIEPKLLQEGGLHEENLQVENLQEEDLQEGDGDGESSLPPEVVAETQDVSLPAVKPVDVEVGPISSPTRDKISQLIQDAGFRSRIDSDLMGSQENVRFEKSVVERARDGGLESLDEVEGEDEEEESAVPSPAFSGFLSSPPPEMGGDDSMDVDHGDQDDTPSGENNGNAMDFADSFMNETAVPESTNTTPRDPVPSDHPKSVPPSDDGLHFISDDKNDSSYTPDNDQNLEQSSCPPSYQLPPLVEESLLQEQQEEQHSEEEHPQGSDDVQEYLNQDPVQGNQNKEGEEDEVQDEQGQANQSESEESNREESNREDGGSQKSLEQDNQFEDSLEYLDTTLPRDDLEESQNARPQSAASSTVTNPCPGPADDSQFDLPTLDELLASTAPARGEKSPKSSEDPKGKRRAFSSPRKAASSPSSNTGRSPSPQLPPVNSTSPKPEPEPSQAAHIKQNPVTVDLTLTSDPIVSPAGSDGEFVDSPLPNGPGWVEKRTSGRGLRKRTSGSTVGNGREDHSSISPPRPRRRGRPPRYSQ